MADTTPSYAGQISAIQVPDGGLYEIKDKWCREQLGVSLGLEVIAQLPSTSATNISNYLGKIYLILHDSHGGDTNVDPNAANIYDEYILIDHGSEVTPRYEWEKIGTTDIDLSSYSQVGHQHSYIKTTGVVQHSFSVKPTVNISQGTGTTNFTPAGTISGSAQSAGGHSHTFTQFVQYLHKHDVVQYLTNTTVLKGLNKSKLQTISINNVVSNGTITPYTFTGVQVAKAGTNVQFSSMGTISTTDAQKITPTKRMRATGSLGTQTWSRTDDTPMWGAQVVQEVLSFSFRPLSTAQTVSDMSFAATNAQRIAKVTQNIIPAVDNGWAQYATAGTAIDVAKVQGTQTVATGKLQSNDSNGAEIPIPTTSGQTISVAQYGTARAVFDTIDSSSSNGTSVTRWVQCSTNTQGAHTHTLDATFTGQGVQLVASTDAQSITLTHTLNTTTETTT